MQVLMKDSEWRRFWAYVDACPDEIAAFGYIEPNDEGDLYVDEIFLVPQIISGAEVDFFTHGLPYAVQKATEEGKIDKLRFCIHSHVNFGTSFSTTDDDMISKVGAGSLTPWFVSAVFNKKGDTNCRLDIFGRGLNDLPGLKHVSGIKLDIDTDAAVPEYDEAIIKEIETFCKKRPAAKTIKKGEKGNKPIRAEVPTDALMNNNIERFHDMTADEFEREVENAIEIHAKAEALSWTYADDSYGFRYFFDDEGTFMTSCMSEDFWTPGADDGEEVTGVVTNDG